MREFDLCVIGSGPGGQKAAIQAAKLGRSVCVVERMEAVGGVAIHTGTIPSKALREAIIRKTAGRDYLAVRADVGAGRLTVEELIHNCREIIATEIGIVRGQLERNGITVVTGQARFLDDNTVSVVSSAGEQGPVRATNVLIAVGTVPARPAEIPFDETHVFTSDDLMKLQRFPRSLVVMGGGVIGTEFASMFARLGVRVTIIERHPRILSFLDPEIGEALQYHLREQGMTLRLGENVTEVRLAEVACEDGSDQRQRVECRLESGKLVCAEALLYCQGRVGAVEDLGLDALSLEADPRGRLAVDEDYRTARDHVYAVGDVIGYPALASTSMDQGRVAACRMFDEPVTSTPQLFPYGIYSIPEISMVGAHEEQLTEDGVPYEVGMARYEEIARGQLIGDDVGMLKILFHRETLAVLGVHAIGTGATELIHIGQAVIALGGGLEYLVNTAFNYPTLAECYKVAALNGMNKVRDAGMVP